MKSYKEFERKIIGESDIASLILVGMGFGENTGIKLDTLDFGMDEVYSAYIVDEPAEIGEHYKLVHQFSHWLKIYDDNTKTASFRAKEINIYRAGMMGCIIELIN